MNRQFKAILRKVKREILRIACGNGLDWLPIRKTLPTYNSNKFGHDIKAALNVALLALPQGMAYAAIADLPIYYGIVCSGLAAIVAPLFSSSRHTILGPTNATSFMVFSFFAVSAGTLDKSPEAYMPLLVIMVGIMSVLGALFKVADLLQYVSRSVLVGYITGAALLILTNQLKHVLGIAEGMKEGFAANTFFSIAEKMAGLSQSYQLQPIILGGATLLLYILLQKKIPALPNFAISLTISAIAGWILRTQVPGFESLETFSAFELDALSPSLPDFNWDDISALMGVAFAIAFLASLENTVMSKSLASRSGSQTDVNQDMLSVGMANIATSLVAAMPASGSLTRSALNYESHSKSRFSSIFCGALCLLGFLSLIHI